MKQTSKALSSRPAPYLLWTVFLVIVIITLISAFVFYLSLKAETHIRYVGIKNVVSEKIGKTVWGMEMNAKNVFDEVGKHLDTPDAVIEALESKASLNPEVRGYFAAFVPDYFPEKGMWFEPYVHQSGSSGHFQVTLVGSARHNYTKSDWYVRALKTHESFWSDPYYYYDGTNTSGHYCTFVMPVFDSKGHLACVSGADMTFEWLTMNLEQIDAKARNNELLNEYRLFRDLDFYTVMFSSDGTCIAHPEGKGVTITDKNIIADFAQKKEGRVDMDVNGVPCTVYYGPIDYVDWSLAVIAPRQDMWKALEIVGLGLLLATVVSLWIVWLVYKKRRAVYGKID